MFKLLVTTTMTSGSWDGGVGVHTVVIEFDDREKADMAAGLIQCAGHGLHTSRTCLKLYV